MRMPRDGSHYSQFLRYGRYHYGKLQRAGMKDLASQIAALNAEVLTTGRATEDVEYSLVDFYADRDGEDDDLDTNTQLARLNLFSREIGADKKLPYTAIFPDGSAYYTEADLDEQMKHYQLFISRVTENLPDTDIVRTDILPRIQTSLSNWQAASEALPIHQSVVQSAKDKRDAAIAALKKQMSDNYHSLSTTYDERKAERFFLRERKGDTPASSETP